MSQYASPVRREQIEPLRLLVVQLRDALPNYYKLPLERQWVLINELARTKPQP